MKKNMLITNLFLSYLAISAGLLVSTPVSAAPVEVSNTQENIIAKTTQQLSQLKETKQHFCDQKKTNDTQFSTIEKQIKIIQLDLDQLAKIKTAGAISNSASLKEDQRISMIPDSSTVPLKVDPIVEKKERLMELRQKQARLKDDNQSLAKPESEVTKQETQLSEKIASTKQAQTKKSLGHNQKSYVSGS